VLDGLRQWYWTRVERRCARDPVCSLLRREVTRVGQEFEARAYSDLQRPSEELSFSTVIEDVAITFNAEAFILKRNGDVGFCIDARAQGVKARWQPSYQFYKRPDGSVYH
jgi:hypothetical protein